jgi:hypothetical protein
MQDSVKRITNWFKDKQLICFRLETALGKRIHTEEDQEDFEQSLEILTSQIDCLDTGKYNLIVWAKKGSSLEKSENTFRIVEERNNSSKNDMSNNDNMLLTFLMKSMDDNSRNTREMMQINHELQMENFKIQQEQSTKTNQLLDTFKELVPHIAPAIMKKLMPNS